MKKKKTFCGITNSHQTTINFVPFIKIITSRSNTWNHTERMKRQEYGLPIWIQKATSDKTSNKAYTKHRARRIENLGAHFSSMPIQVCVHVVHTANFVHVNYLCLHACTQIVYTTVYAIMYFSYIFS